jgi:lipoprotein NlpI
MAYNNRGLLYKSLGKTKEAKADFAKAKALEK